MNLAIYIKSFETLIDTTKLRHKFPELSDKMLKGSLLTLDDLIKNLVDYIQNQIFNVSAKTNVEHLLSVFCLMISNDNNRKEMQNLFNSNQAMIMVLKILSNEKTLDDKMLKI